MKCANFICIDHRSYNKYGCVHNDFAGTIVRACEARKRYNRILNTRFLRYTSNNTEYRGYYLDSERDKYHGRE